MLLEVLLVVHICAATVGLLSGYLSLFLRKGSGWHNAAGTVFFVSMLVMSVSAAYIAAFLKPIMLNVIVSLLVFYLVSTAWWTARHRDGKAGRFERIALLFILLVGIAGVGFGFEAAGSPTGTKDRMPAFLYFMFGVVALLCASTDVRLLRRGGVTGGKRIARHLWRMCLALLISTLSFYPGQAKLFPAAVRETNLLIVPHLVVIASMVIGMARVSMRRRARRGEAEVPRPTLSLSPP